MDAEARTLSHRLLSVAAVRAIEQCAIAGYGITGYEMMQRAAAAAWRELVKRWPKTRRVIVVCGAGNNGGDGYEIACLALSHGHATQVIEPLRHAAKGDALAAREAWIESGGAIAEFFPGDSGPGDVIVDALFGTGLSRPVDELARRVVARINDAHAHGCGVLAVDVPSGLSADTGAVLGAAVQADLTMTFIGHKPGLHTGQGPAFCGQVRLDDLGLPASVLAEGAGLGRLQHADDLRTWLPPRPRTAHKGDHGHVLVIGGDHGMTGAVLLCARASLRAGAGLVSVATRGAHAVSLTAAQPELMCHAVDSVEALSRLFGRADVIAIGPGLGRDDWGRAMLAAVESFDRPLVADADALNLLAESPDRKLRRILTPHPGEAARLLGCSTAQVQADRIAAVREMRERYGGVAILKGAGTLVFGECLSLCPYGNPGMGVGGMGDALTGILAALLAQGLRLEDGANAGVLLHALAGDRAAMHGERGLLPSDLIASLRSVVNP